jgi:hypothetical protein
VDGNRFEWWGEYPETLGCRGDIAVLGRQSDDFRREYLGPTFWTPPIETVPADNWCNAPEKPLVST